MKLYILATASAIILNASRPTCTSVIAQTGVPSVFLSEELWTGGVIVVLAAFLLWQQWTREQVRDRQSQEREQRMAARIDTLENNLFELVTQVTTAVGKINSLPDELAEFRAVVEKNCAACDARRDAIAAKIDSLRGG